MLKFMFMLVVLSLPLGTAVGANCTDQAAEKKLADQQKLTDPQKQALAPPIYCQSQPRITN